MNKIISFFFIIITKLTFGQRVEVVFKSNIKLESYPIDKASVFIHPKTNVGQLQFVATYKVNGKDSFALPGDLFLLIKMQARKDGGNFFKLKSFFYDSLKKPYLSIDSYYGSDASIETNNLNYETNDIYIYSVRRKLVMILFL